MSERLQRYVLWLLAVTLVVGTGLALKYARGYRPAAGFAFSGPPALPGDVALRFNTVKVIGRKDNRRAWILKAGRVDTTRSRSRVDFSGNVEATLLNQECPRATFTAPQATYDVGAKVLVAAGQVACVVQPATGTGSRTSIDSRRPLRIEANQVVWNVGSQTVACPGTVRVTLPDLTVTGDDLTVDLRTREHSVKRFHATLTLTDDSGSRLPAIVNALKGLLP
jgi:lipopolysaccharide assembly outer membrane protein LptD (OstA)